MYQEDDCILIVSNTDGPVTWSSSNPSVVSVESDGPTHGLLRSVSIGTAIITASVDGYTLSCTVYVVFPDGIYTLWNDYDSGNLCFNTCDIDGASNGRIWSYSNNELALTQYWKLHHIESGYYSLRPWHNLNAALYADTSASRVRLDFQPSDTNLPDNYKWQILVSPSNTAIKNKANQMVMCTSSSGYDVTFRAYSASAEDIDWYINEAVNPPAAVLLYDSTTGEMVCSSYAGEATFVKNIPLDSTLSISQLGLEAFVCDAQVPSQIVNWTSDDTSVIRAYYNNSFNFTALQPGRTTIVGTRGINNSPYTVRFILTVVSCSVSVETRYDNAYAAAVTNPQSTIITYMENLREFYLEEVGIDISFSTPTPFTSYADSCPAFTDNDPETNTCTCGDCFNAEYLGGDILYLNYHHTNLNNILYSLVDLPDDFLPDLSPIPTNALIAFTGHDTCYNCYTGHYYNHSGMQSSTRGRADSSLDIACVSTMTIPDFPADHHLQTTIHELGHLFGAPDHYGVVGMDSTYIINIKYEGYNFSDFCIYGGDKDELTEPLVCDGCRRMMVESIRLLDS